MPITRKFLFILSLAIISVFVFESTVLAQITEAENTTGLESCFNYYDYGKVEVNLATEKQVYKVGETAKIIGTVVNQNSFPLVSVIIYAQLRRINTGDVLNEGHHLIERKQITPPMNLLDAQTRFIKAEIPLLEGYPDGNYQLQFYVVSTSGFHYAGRPFLEEDFAGTSFLEIKNSSAPLVYFDPSSINVGQKQYPIRGITQEYEEDVLNLSASFIDNRTTKTDIPVTIKFYSFEDTFEEYLISEQKAVSKNGKVNVQFRPPDTGAYVMVMRIDSPTVSELKFRFAQINGVVPALRINDFGVTSYPSAPNDKAYVCVYSPAPVDTGLTSLKLEVLDKNKTTVGQKIISSEFSSNIVALSLPLSGIKDNKDFWIRTTIKSQNEPEDRILETHYSCEQFKSSPQDLTVDFKSDSLSIDAISACGQKIINGGYIESLRIKNIQGAIVKEFYNLDKINQNIDMQDLPKGDYIAQVKSGKILKNYPFKVTGKSKNPGSLILLVATLSSGFILLGAGVFYFIKRKSKPEFNVPEQV